MRTHLTLTRLAGLLAMSALVVAGLGCNEHDDPGQAENVVLVKSITLAGTSVADPNATTATVEFSTNPRNPGNLENPISPSPTTFWHEITLTSYTVSYEPGVIAPMSGPISTGFCPPASICSVEIVLVPSGSKPAAGTTVVAHIDFEGRDVNDNPVNFSADAAIVFVP
jgi:hypothetical protein